MTTHPLSRRPASLAAALLVLLLAALLVSGCSGNRAAVSDAAPVASAPSIAPEELPAGPGRGYPTVAAEGAGDATDARPGQPAPNFRLTLADGSSLSLESLRGRPVVINHWATWCGPCRLEMPEIVRASQEHEELVVVAANLMEAQETMVPFVEQYGMEFPVTVDPDGELAELYGVRGLPMTIFIDREGMVSAVWAGILTPDKLDELLGAIL